MAKYNFKGIKTIGAAALLGWLATILAPMGLSWLVTNWFSKTIINFFVKKMINSMANNGLVILNTGGMLIGTGLSEKALVSALEAGIKAMSQGGLDEQGIKNIDDEIIKAFRSHAIIVK